MSVLAAHGGPPTVDIAGPHYQWPFHTAELERAVVDQTRRSLSDRDASGILGEFEDASLLSPAPPTRCRSPPAPPRSTP